MKRYVIVLVACGAPSRPAEPLRGESPDNPAASALATDGECIAPGGVARPRLTGRDAIVRLTRTGCTGNCANYDLLVREDGSVEFIGERFVKTCSGTAQLTDKALAELEVLFRLAIFDVLPDYTTHGPKETARAETSYGQRTVTHYLADPSAPHALFDVEKGIERIVGVEQWTGTPSEVNELYVRWLIRTTRSLEFKP